MLLLNKIKYFFISKIKEIEEKDIDEKVSVSFKD